MDFTGTSSLYDILEVAPDATPQDIRAAYLRAKNAYRADSVALYSLMSSEETHELLARIEYAYQILSSPERRREYDRNFGRIDETSHVDRNAAVRAIVNSDKVVSIDRVPPMDSSGTMDDLLVAPSTDFTAPPTPGTRGSAAVFESSEAPLPMFGQSAPPPPARAPSANSAPPADRGWIEISPFGQSPSSRPAPPTRPAAPPADAFAPPVQPSSTSPIAHSLPNAERPRTPSAAVNASDEIAIEIAHETDWTGKFLRKVRESRSVSIEELSEFTKISKTYLLAVEEENFAKLPATVYLRGFVTQYCKALKLPADKVLAAYLVRFHQARPEKK